MEACGGCSGVWRRVEGCGGGVVVCGGVWRWCSGVWRWCSGVWRWCSGVWRWCSGVWRCVVVFGGGVVGGGVVKKPPAPSLASTSQPGCAVLCHGVWVRASLVANVCQYSVFSHGKPDRVRDSYKARERERERICVLLKCIYRGTPG